jgi:transposase
MKQKSGPDKAPPERVLKDIRRQTRRQYSAEEKIRIVLEGLRGEENISELCRREGIAASMCYGSSKEFLEAGKRRLAGDTARAATSGEGSSSRGCRPHGGHGRPHPGERTACSKTYGPPRCKGAVVRRSWSASTYPVSGFILANSAFILANMGSARLGPHKVYGAARHIFDQAAETPVRPLRHLSFTFADRLGRGVCRPISFPRSCAVRLVGGFMAQRSPNHACQLGSQCHHHHIPMRPAIRPRTHAPVEVGLSAK